MIQKNHTTWELHAAYLNTETVFGSTYSNNWRQEKSLTPGIKSSTHQFYLRGGVWARAFQPRWIISRSLKYVCSNAFNCSDTGAERKGTTQSKVSQDDVSREWNQSKFNCIESQLRNLSSGFTEPEFWKSESTPWMFHLNWVICKKDWKPMRNKLG